ncbi:MAG TPA: hypothetical protein VLH81_07575 [Desulfobacterales bacterium]|nr:hypothetical protein [Desulfobacterales bacterium]
MKPKRATIVFVAALALFISGCATGGVRSNPDVAQSFRNLSVPPGYSYWYLNLENDPYAVAGLERGWRIEDNLWQAVDPGTPTFGKVVGLVADFPVPGFTTFGATLVDPEGAPIGIWFSSLIPGIQVDADRKVVIINTATPWMGGPDGGNSYD